MTADELEALDDRPASELIPVPEWGGVHVRLRAMPLNERDDVVFESRALIREGKHIGKLRCRVLARCLLAADGAPIFADAERGERVLLTKSPTAIDALWKRCEKLNGLGDDDEKPTLPN